MSKQSFTADEAILAVGCSRATFFSYRKKLDIKPIKRGNKAFYTIEQIEAIQQCMTPLTDHTDIDEHKTDINRQTKQSHTQVNRHKTDTKQTHTDTPELSTYLKTELERKHEELKNAQEQIQQLAQEVGRWQGRSQTLEELNQELKVRLLDRPTPPIRAIDSPDQDVSQVGKKGRWWAFWRR